MSEIQIYQDSEWPHGLRCGNESCDFLFQDGDEIHSVPLSMFEDGTPVEEIICWRCAVGAEEK